MREHRLPARGPDACQKALGALGEEFRAALADLYWICRHLLKPD